MFTFVTKLFTEFESSVGLFFNNSFDPSLYRSKTKISAYNPNFLIVMILFFFTYAKLSQLFFYIKQLLTRKAWETGVHFICFDIQTIDMLGGAFVEMFANSIGILKPLR